MADFRNFGNFGNIRTMRKYAETYEHAKKTRICYEFFEILREHAKEYGSVRTKSDVYENMRNYAEICENMRP